MKIIIPMAGMGKRMRPHTLTVPKPLISVAGKPIVQRLVEDIVTVCNDTVEEIGFIISPLFSEDVKESLLAIAENLGTTGKLYYQQEALGTAHAIYCAKESISGNVIVAFADTLFIADFNLDSSNDSTIWVQKVDDPSAFGVVKLDDNGFITDFIEKPKEPISDLAIIGIYYFKDGDNLRNELQYLIDNKVMVNGEYQLTDALENMKNKGVKFGVGEVNEWLDCGNKNATVETNSRVLNNVGNTLAISAKITNSVINEPCYIGENVEIKDSVVGPFVTLHDNCKVDNSIIKESLVQSDTTIQNANIVNSMIGSSCNVEQQRTDINLGDFSELTK